MGHPGQGHYHYHFLAYGDSENAYDGCLMSCNGAEVGGIVGIALDGFPFYGPMQYYSASEGKVYNDPRNCDDCELTQDSFQIYTEYAVNHTLRVKCEFGLDES